METTNTFEPVYERLLLASGTKNDSELARVLGISPQSVNGARKRGEIPPGWVQSYAEISRVSCDWIFFGRGPMRFPEDAKEDPSIPSGKEAIDAQEEPPKPLSGLVVKDQGQCDVDLIMVPMVEARLSAGTGSLETSGDIERTYAFRSDFLHRKGNPENMVLMRVGGDSMQPEIMDKDIVLLDQGKRDLRPGPIFAVGFEEAIYLKRIDMLPGKIILKSANPAYAPVELDIREQNGESFHVIGQVIWSGREY